MQYVFVTFILQQQWRMLLKRRYSPQLVQLDVSNEAPEPTRVHLSSRFSFVAVFSSNIDELNLSLWFIFGKRDVIGALKKPKRTQSVKTESEARRGNCISFAIRTSHNEIWEKRGILRALFIIFSFLKIAGVLNAGNSIHQAPRVDFISNQRGSENRLCRRLFNSLGSSRGWRTPNKKEKKTEK